MLEGTEYPEESPKLENSSNVCPNPATIDFAPTQPPTTTSSLNYSEEIPELENGFSRYPNPTTIDLAPTKPSPTSSHQNRKFFAFVLFTVASLLGIGLLYYHGSLTTDPTLEQRDPGRSEQVPQLMD